MRISQIKEALARSLILAGTTTRNVGRMAGLGRMTAWRLSKLVLRGQPPPHCQCGRLAKHIGMCSYRLSQCPSYLARRLRHLASINIHVPKPRYDYSRRAEIGFLTKQSGMVCLDARCGKWNDSAYDFIPSEELSPLEILMQKESENL